MMIHLKLDRVGGSAECHSQLYSCKESFLALSYCFESGNTYGLVSDFGRGSWALAWFLGGRGENFNNGEVRLNDESIEHELLGRYSCFVGEHGIDSLTPGNEEVSIRKHIEMALEASSIPFSVADVKRMFELSDERFERDLDHVSGEIFRITAAIGFAEGKEIFCWPWRNAHEPGFDPRVAKTLRDNGKIVLVPTCRSIMKSPLKKAFDHVIDFHDPQNPSFVMSKEDRKWWRKNPWI